MKTGLGNNWMLHCGAQPAAGKGVKRTCGTKKKGLPVSSGNVISPESHNIRGDGRVATYLRNTPAP